MLKSVTIIGTVNIPKNRNVLTIFIPTLTPVYEAAHSSGFYQAIIGIYSVREIVNIRIRYLL